MQSEELKNLRTSLNFSQKKFAKILRISAQYINALENNKKPITENFLERLKKNNVTKSKVKKFYQPTANEAENISPPLDENFEKLLLLKESGNQAERLRFIRNKMGLTRKVFAASIGVNLNKIANTENSQSSITIEMAKKINNRYNYVNHNWLLTGEGEPFINEYPETQQPEMQQLRVKQQIMQQPEPYKTNQNQAKDMLNEKVPAKDYIIPVTTELQGGWNNVIKVKVPKGTKVLVEFED